MVEPGPGRQGSEAVVRVAIERAFGAENRSRLLDEYLAGAGDIGATTAWEHVYRLLLWIDRSTGLAHCYESDKCQPGRPWYARSLAFHSWVSAHLGSSPADLATAIDWLFRRAVQDLAVTTANSAAAAAVSQRAPYEGQGFPLPGEDTELVELVREELAPFLADEPPPDSWRVLVERIHAHIGQENKRKNLVGEGFEDTLAAIIRKVSGPHGWEVRNRVLLGELPAFHPQSEAEKKKRVDVAAWTSDGQRRILITSKWSVRADREEQFGTDFDAYVRLNRGRPFDYVLITNEFDAARLKAACQKVSQNAPLFSRVVHVNPAGVLAAYGSALRSSAKEIPGLIEEGRLLSLGDWLAEVFG